MNTPLLLRIVRLLQALVERLPRRSRSEHDAVRGAETGQAAGSRSSANEPLSERRRASDQRFDAGADGDEGDEGQRDGKAETSLEVLRAEEVLTTRPDPDAEDAEALLLDSEHGGASDVDSVIDADAVHSGGSADDSLVAAAAASPESSGVMEDAPVGVASDGGSVPGDREEIAAPEPPLDATPRPSLPQGRAAAGPREPARPSDPNVLPARYRAWNRAIAEYCLGRPSGAMAYLTVTPQVLAAAWLEAFQEAKDANDAAADFAAAVSDAYTMYVLTEPHGLWVLSATTRESLPDSIAFLALSVLAAYEMHADEEAGPNAFYIRLADLLEVELIGGHPRGFNTQDFEALWQHLHDWTWRRDGGVLAMPTDPGPRRFLALPLTHAPLRKMDVDKLPAFFVWASYEGGAREDVELLGRDLIAWQLARSPLSLAGAAAVADERLSAVAAQVALELEAWDGCLAASAGTRSASVQLQLDFVRRQPLLHFLARRPLDFPSRFDDGRHVFEAGEDGWYDPVLIPRDAGDDLASGFSWTVQYGSETVELRRAAAAAIALAPAREMTGFVSRRGLAGGLACAVLCRDELLGSAQDYLSAVAQRRCHAVQHTSVPDGWVLFPNVVPLRHEAVPAGLEALEVGFAVEIVPVGGLRLGPARWLAGAAPTVFIGGVHDGVTPRIDDDEVPLLTDGRVDDQGHLSSPGRHRVEAGTARRRVDIVEPELNVSMCTNLVDEAGMYVEALPADSEWMVIGAQIGDVARPDVSTTRGALARVSFEPQWAISAARQAAMCLSNGGPRPAARPSTASVALTPAQFSTLDRLAETQPEAKVVGVAGELVEVDAQRAAVVPIIRDGSGGLHVLTAEGALVDASDPAVVLHPDSPALVWASAIYDAGVTPALLGSALDDVDEAELADSWAAYYEAARQFEPLLRRLRR